MIQFSVRLRPTSSGSRFRQITESLASQFHFACQFRFRFCLPTSFGSLPIGSNSNLLACQFPVLLAGRFPNCMPANFWICLPVFGNLVTIIHQDKVVKVLLAQMNNEGAQGAYIARALSFLSMWDKS